MRSVSVTDLAKLAECEGMVLGEVPRHALAQAVDGGVAERRGNAEHRLHDLAVVTHMSRPADPAAAPSGARVGWLRTLVRWLGQLARWLLGGGR